MIRIQILITLIISFFIISCASLPSKDHWNEEQLLAARADLYWKSFTERNWDTLERLIDPNIKKDLASYIKSLRQSKPMADYLSYEKKDLNINGRKAIVRYKLKIRYLHPLLQSLPPQEKFFSHKWIKRDKQWYIVMKSPNMESFLDYLSNK